MKLRKLIFAAAGVLLLGIGAFLASAFNKTNSHSSDLVSANIEALADSEAGGGGLRDTLSVQSELRLCYKLQERSFHLLL